MTIEPVEVLRGTHKDLSFHFGPLPGFRLDNVVTYEFELPERFEPWPGRTRLERTFVLLDVGVSFANPCWVRDTRPDGTVVTTDLPGRDSWYVDLVTVEAQGNRYTVRAPRVCYVLSTMKVMNRWSRTSAKAAKDKPATVSGSRS